MIAPTVAPHTTMPDGRGPPRGRVQVRRRVARQLVRGVAEPDQDRPDEQQRERARDDRDRRDDGARRRRSRSPADRPIRRPRADHEPRRGGPRRPAAPRTTAAPGAPLQQRRSRRGPAPRSSRRSPPRCARCCRARRRATSDHDASAGEARRGGRPADRAVAHRAAMIGATQSRPSVRPRRGRRPGVVRGASAISTNRQNAFASRIWSGRPRADARADPATPTTTATQRARDVATLRRLPAVQEVHPARRELRARRRHRVDADRRLLALELVDRPDPRLARAAAARIAPTWALYGATIRTSSQPIGRRDARVGRSTSRRPRPATRAIAGDGVRLVRRLVVGARRCATSSSRGPTPSRTRSGASSRWTSRCGSDSRRSS